MVYRLHEFDIPQGVKLVDYYFDCQHQFLSLVICYQQKKYYYCIPFSEAWDWMYYAHIYEPDWSEETGKVKWVDDEGIPGEMDVEDWLKEYDTKDFNILDLYKVGYLLGGINEYLKEEA